MDALQVIALNDSNKREFDELLKKGLANEKAVEINVVKNKIKSFDIFKI